MGLSTKSSGAPKTCASKANCRRQTEVSPTCAANNILALPFDQSSLQELGGCIGLIMESVTNAKWHNYALMLPVKFLEHKRWDARSCTSAKQPGVILTKVTNQHAVCMPLHYVCYCSGVLVISGLLGNSPSHKCRAQSACRVHASRADGPEDPHVRGDDGSNCKGT